MQLQIRIYFLLGFILFESKSSISWNLNEPSYPCNKSPRPEGLDVTLFYGEEWKCKKNLKPFEFDSQSFKVKSLPTFISVQFSCEDEKLIRMDSKSTDFMCADQKSPDCYQTLRYSNNNIKAENISGHLSLVKVTLLHDTKDLLYCQYQRWYSWKYGDLPEGIYQEVPDSSRFLPTTLNPKTTTSTPEKKFKNDLTEFLKDNIERSKAEAKNISVSGLGLLAQSRTGGSGGDISEGSANFLPALIVLGVIAGVLFVGSGVTILTVCYRNNKSQNKCKTSANPSAPPQVSLYNENVVIKLNNHDDQTATENSEDK